MTAAFVVVCAAAGFLILAHGIVEDLCRFRAQGRRSDQDARRYRHGPVASPGDHAGAATAATAGEADTGSSRRGEVNA